MAKEFKNEDFTVKKADDIAVSDYKEAPTPTEMGETVKPNEDYYSMLKNEEYKALLDREIQLGNARERALKQTNANLSALGLASAGYGQTARSGIESQYLQALEGAQNDYQTSIRDINKQSAQEGENKQYSDWQEFTTMMTSAENKEDLDYLMNTYGLYKDGQFDSEKAVELFGEDHAKQLQYLYNIQVKGYDSQVGNMAYNYNDGKDVTVYYYDTNGKANSMKLKDGREDGWNKENRTLNAAIATGSLKDNSVVAMINKHGNVIYVRYSNGQLYYINPDQYHASSNKYSILMDGNIEEGTGAFDKMNKLKEATQNDPIL